MRQWEPQSYPYVFLVYNSSSHVKQMAAMEIEPDMLVRVKDQLIASKIARHEREPFSLA